MSSTVTGHCHLRVGTADTRTVGGGFCHLGKVWELWPCHGLAGCPPHSQSSHPEAWCDPSQRFKSRAGANPFQTAPPPAFPHCLDSGCPTFLNVPLTALSLHLGVWNRGPGVWEREGAKGGGWWSPASGEMIRDSVPLGTAQDRTGARSQGNKGPLSFREIRRLLRG